MEKGHWDFDPVEIEKRELREFDRVFAKLIESGAELDPMRKAQLRAYVQQVLGMFGVQSVEGLMEVRQRLYAEQEVIPLPTPPRYPEKVEFQKRLLEVYFEEPSPRLRQVSANPEAIDVATHGQYDWGTIQARDERYTLDYLYDLGKAMVVRPAYEALFPPEDAIIVGANWHIEKGQHRSLVLRTLGPEFVTQAHMSDWVTVTRSQNN